MLVFLDNLAEYLLLNIFKSLLWFLFNLQLLTLSKFFFEFNVLEINLDVLFEKLGLPGGKKGATSYKTDVKVLHKIINEDQFILPFIQNKVKIV